MKHNLAQKKDWVTPSIEEASINITEAQFVQSPIELFVGGAPADEPGGPS